MKIKVLAITVLLCCLHAIYIFGASEDKYKVRSKEKNITRIEVLGNCDIVIADIAPKGKDTIYGDIVGNVGYGGKYFEQKQVKPNEGKQGVKISRIDGRVVLSVIHAALKENTKIKIFPAVFKSGDYCSDTTAFTILVEKGKSVSTTESKDTDSLKKEIDLLKEKMESFDNGLHGILPLLGALFVGLFFGYLLFKQNRKALKKLSEECSDLKRDVDSLKNKNNIHEDIHQITQQKDKGRNSMTDEDIKRFIVEQIKNSQTQFSPSTFQTAVAANSNEDPTGNPVKKEELVTDTDNVKFHLEDNSFTLEQTDQKIFRIYSKEGEFYYTIVNDSAVREEFSCMIQTFGGFLNYLSTSGEATSIEVVNDGKLRKNGNRFYVDANNKLVVKFV